MFSLQNWDFLFICDVLYLNRPCISVMYLNCPIPIGLELKSDFNIDKNIMRVYHRFPNVLFSEHIEN